MHRVIRRQRVHNGSAVEQQARDNEKGEEKIEAEGHRGVGDTDLEGQSAIQREARWACLVTPYYSQC